MLKHQPGRTCVLIANSSAMARELLVSAFNRKPHFKVVAQVASGAEILECLKSARVDVALINASLQDGPLSGIGALRQMRESHPDVRSVILFDSPDPQLIADAFRAGARGVFCSSTSEFKGLCKCVERVHAGQIWANSDELNHVMEAFGQLAPLRVVNAAGLKLLSKREEDVVRLLAEGFGNRDIARELSLSEHTVKNYLFKIFDKLGVSSRVEVVLYAVSTTKRMQFADTQDSGKSGIADGDATAADKIVELRRR